MTGIELMRTLDERHIASSLQFEAMHIGAVMVLDGPPMLDAHGTIDRRVALDTLRRALRGAAEFRMRLMNAPLGITTPAWVTDESFSLERHVFFDDGPAQLDGSSVRRLVGADRGPLHRDRPLWEVTFTRLVSGEVALGARLHHVVGDGQWGFDVIRRLMSHAPVPPDADAVLPPLPPAPRSRLAIPLHAARSFLTAFPPPAAAWREYWRKPVVKRIRRMGGRNIRPLSEWWIRRRGLRSRYLPPTRVGLASVPLADVEAAARAAGASLNDLFVAAALGSVDDDRRGLDTLVPVSRRRTDGRGEARNHIAMIRVHVPPGADMVTRLADVRRAVRSAIAGRDLAAPEGRMVGYATLMPLSEAPLWFGPARIVRVVAPPVGDPRSELSALGLVYDGEVSIATVSRAELDVDGMTGRIARTIGVVQAAGSRSAALRTGTASAQEVDAGVIGQEEAVA
jgi:diacylglycerol O-acyltransferase / wax synthase